MLKNVGYDTVLQITFQILKIVFFSNWCFCTASRLKNIVGADNIAKISFMSQNVSPLFSIPTSNFYKQLFFRSLKFVDLYLTYDAKLVVYII